MCSRNKLEDDECDGFRTQGAAGVLMGVELVGTGVASRDSISCCNFLRSFWERRCFGTEGVRGRGLPGLSPLAPSAPSFGRLLGDALGTD